LFFPERRQFFIENGDLFTNFGYQTLRPFFSRRIGLGTPIHFGARLSGKLNKNWRLGVMNMQTGAVEETSLPTQNFAVVALQRRVFSRSNIGAIFINKESINYQPGTDLTKPVYTRYNRNMGLEYNLASSNNQWTGKALVLKSFSPGRSGEDMVYAGNLLYASKRWTIGAQYEYVGRNYNPEVGYVPRRGYMKLNSQIGYLFFPKGTRILSHGPVFNSINYFNTSVQATDNENYLVYNVTFRNRSNFAAWVAHDYVQLLQPFDPTNSGKDTLARNTRIAGMPGVLNLYPSRRVY
jgi:hypothetical protein